MILPKPIFVRKAKSSDAACLSELYIEFYGKESDLNAMRENLEKLSDNPHYFVAVACEETRVVGTAMGIVCVDLVGLCKPFMLIENVVVLPECRDRGIGKLLMQSLERFGRESGCSYIILVSEAARERSHRFYESIGYSADQRGFKKKL